MLVLELSEVIKVVITAKVFDVTRIVTTFSHNIAWCWADENNSGTEQFLPSSEQLSSVFLRVVGGAVVRVPAMW